MTVQDQDRTRMSLLRRIDLLRDKTYIAVPQQTKAIATNAMCVSAETASVIPPAATKQIAAVKSNTINQRGVGE